MIIGIDVRTAIGEKAGIGNYTYNLVKNLAEIDKKNYYILYSNKLPDFKLSNEKFQIKIFKYPSVLWHLRVFLDIIFNKVDIYHTSSMIIPSMLKNRCAIFIPDVTNFLFPQYHTLKVKISKIFYKRAIRNAKAVLTNSLNSKNDIISLFGDLNNKITITYLAASDEFKIIDNLAYLEKIRSIYNLPDKFILFVGSIEPRKNLKGLIEAFSRIKEIISHKLVVVGGKGWLNSEIYKVIEEKQLQNNIIFTGYVPDKDLVVIYNLADLFVYPSFYEGFGFPVLEAMSCGVPVISSNTSSLPEVCGDAGIMVNPYDNEQLAETILKVLKDQFLRNKMITEGLKQTKKFSWENTTKQTLSVFEELTEA